MRERRKERENPPVFSYTVHCRAEICFTGPNPDTPIRMATGCAQVPSVLRPSVCSGLTLFQDIFRNTKLKKVITLATFLTVRI